MDSSLTTQTSVNPMPNSTTTSLKMPAAAIGQESAVPVERSERVPLPIPSSITQSKKTRQPVPRTSLDPAAEDSTDSLVGCLGSCYEIRSWAIFVGVIDVAVVLPLTCITLVLGLETRHWEQPPSLPATGTPYSHAVDLSVLPRLIGSSAGYWSIFRLIAVTCCAYVAVQGTRRNIPWMLQCWLMNTAGNVIVTVIFMVAFAMAANETKLAFTDYSLMATLGATALIGISQFPFIFSRFRRAKRLAKTATALTTSSLPYGHLA